MTQEAVGNAVPVDDLSPAEAHAMLDPERVDAVQAVKASVLGLTLRGVLRIDSETRSGLLGAGTERWLRPGAPPARPLPPHERVLLELVAADGGCTMADLGRRAAKAFGGSYAGFLGRHLFPDLVARGLLKAETRRVLLLFRSSVHVPTAAGLAVQARLRELAARAAEIPPVLERDPARAAALAASLGPLVLLLPALLPHLGPLMGALQAAERSGLLVEGQVEFDLGGFDLGSVDAIADAAGDLDSGLDGSADGDGSSSGGDSGGDSGGGGDGGGGGGGE